jgi:transitional endoplasmic reticulum ATPase
MVRLTQKTIFSLCLHYQVGSYNIIMQNKNPQKTMSATDKLAAVWSLRAILHPQAFKRIAKTSLFTGEEYLFDVIGLECIVEKEINSFDLYQLFRKHLQTLELQRSPQDDPLLHNIDLLGEMIGLSATEREILLFGLILQSNQGLREAVEYLGSTSIPGISQHLAYILKIKPDKISEALRGDGPLCSSGLIDLNKRRATLDISDRLEVLDGLGHALQDPHADFEHALSAFFLKGPSSRLTLSDFSHLGGDLNILFNFLAASLAQRAAGVNVLLYGPPGTGKTELARVIATNLGVSLYEVSSQDGDGDPACTDRLWRSYLLCQSLFSRRRDCLILFDEMEDVFPSEAHQFFGMMVRSGHNKGWTNRVLESNVVPSIWISNSIKQIDPAFLRRFDFILEVPTPGLGVRRQMMAKMMGGIAVNDEWLEAMVNKHHLVPGHIEKAVKVATLMGADGQDTPEQVIDRVIHNLHKAMGVRSPNRPKKQTPPLYDLAFLNTDPSLVRLEEVCGAESCLKVCLHGPSGTGKTAFVSYLAERLNRKIIAKKASDILGPYVGQTEQQMASMFAEASDQEETILFLDEADSFLQDRVGARQSWEITQVNELLVQMENFEGLFFCATNLIETLDNAVFRRFDLKVKFNFLKPDQAWGLFTRILSYHTLDIPKDEEIHWRTRLAEMSKLTPGDFATAARQLRFTDGRIDANLFLDLLEKEFMYKFGDVKYPVGF